MNTAKWNRHAEEWSAGTLVPANGWEKWNEQAVSEAVTIRSALPDSVHALLEVGCGFGRLTPHLALLFPRIIATDTSAGCRSVTSARVADRRNVRVVEPDHPYTRSAHAALVWCLYDADWTTIESGAHLAAMRAAYPLVLAGTPDTHWLYEA